MQIANNFQQYGLISQVLHWSMAGLMLAMLATGLYMTNMPNGALRDLVYMMHKTTGLTLLLLAVLRLVWTRHNPRPDIASSVTGWQRKVARLVHKVLFFLIFAIPVTGIGMNFFRGAVLEFIVPLNSPSEPFLPLMYFFGALHKFVFPVLLATLVSIHIAGLLKHLWIDGDKLAIRRMFGSIDTNRGKE
ncbi:cytochrome b [Kordiimonas sp.]|uniref:cytochrome b n=1 Tax=Kordiimonas sp. TaxID=1970157 RepID=UPI003B52075F